jgi:hypothetical protein
MHKPKSHFNGRLLSKKKKQQNMEKHLGRDCPLEGSLIFFLKIKNTFENSFPKENLNWKWKVILPSNLWIMPLS